MERFYLKRINGNSEDSLEFVVRSRKTIRDTVHAVEQLEMSYEQLQKLSNKINQNKIEGGYAPIVNKALLRQKAFEVIGDINYTGTLDAVKFAAWVETVRPQLQQELGLKFADDELTKPQKVLGRFLNNMGLKTKGKMGNRNDNRVRQYILDPYQQRQLKNILARRRNRQEEQRVQWHTSEHEVVDWV